VLRFILTLYFIAVIQDGSSIAVAVKTCKADDDPSRADQLLKEAGLYSLCSVLSSVMDRFTSFDGELLVEYDIFTACECLCPRYR